MRRTLGISLAIVLWWLVSCREVPAPQGGIQSISPVILPLPGVVAGDTMRDSLGLAAPLRVIAYDLGGDTVLNATTRFVVLDTGAHMAGGGSLLIGDVAGKLVRVVGSVEDLQTQPAPVFVTLSPDTLVATDSIRHVATYGITDTIVNSAELSTQVLHRPQNSPVDAVIVRYSIVRAPASNGNGPSVVLLSGTIPSTKDTTTSGRASRVARLRRAAAVATDSVVIGATASYRGRSIGTVQFTIIYRSQ